MVIRRSREISEKMGGGGVKKSRKGRYLIGWDEV